jgi:hypothetical protein
MLSWLWDKETLEKLFYIAQAFAMPALGIYALRYAHNQVKEAKESRSQTQKDAATQAEIANAHANTANEHTQAITAQGHARVILELLRQWDATHMLEARVRVVALNNELRPTASYNRPISQVFADKLREMRQAGTPEYSGVLRYCSFFEAAGLMVRHGYVPIKDIAALFSGAILFMEECFAQHIHERQREPGVPPGLYENALDLIRRIRELDAQRQT